MTSALPSALYLSLGILALSVAYHLGAERLHAQIGDSPVLYFTPAGNLGNHRIMTSNGDVWYRFGFDPTNPSHYPWPSAGTSSPVRPRPRANQDRPLCFARSS